jgi:competence ComEA-like helix-hairpin-helix protein
LQQLPGIGESLAARIEQHRPFPHADDLTRVPGVGPALVERLRAIVCVGEEGQRLAAPSPNTSKDTDEAMPRRGGKKTANLDSLVDINRATAAELQNLPGIGPVLSQRIVAERQKQPFETVEDLLRVAGIGRKNFQRLRPYVTVITPAKTEAAAR